MWVEINLIKLIESLFSFSPKPEITNWVVYIQFLSFIEITRQQQWLYENDDDDGLKTISLPSLSWVVEKGEWMDEWARKWRLNSKQSAFEHS